jgi:hypothetical protein
VNSEPVEKPRANNRFSDKEWVLSERIDPGFTGVREFTHSRKTGCERGKRLFTGALSFGYFPLGVQRKVSSQEMFRKGESPVSYLIIANNNINNILYLSVSSRKIIFLNNPG